jgi:hypothetical protein
MAVSAWTKHLKTDEEKAKYLEKLRKQRLLFEHILSMIEDNKASIEAQEITTKAYDNPNWKYRQADCNGYKRCLRDFKTLFTLDHEENNGRQPNAGRPIRPPVNPG